MKKTKPVTTEEIYALICDKCGKSYSHEHNEFHQFYSIDRRAGYGSVFGNKHRVEVDLCQHCFKDLLGDYVRVTPIQRQSYFDDDTYANDDIQVDRDDDRIGD